MPAPCSSATTLATGSRHFCYIDYDRKVIYFVQSKFRQSEHNFEEKVIEPDELLRMDIDWILDGETRSESGADYNAKILRMTRKIRSIEDISR